MIRSDESILEDPEKALKLMQSFPVEVGDLVAKFYAGGLNSLAGGFKERCAEDRINPAREVTIEYVLLRDPSRGRRFREYQFVARAETSELASNPQGRPFAHMASGVIDKLAGSKPYKVIIDIHNNPEGVSVFYEEFLPVLTSNGYQPARISVGDRDKSTFGPQLGDRMASNLLLTAQYDSKDAFVHKSGYALSINGFFTDKLKTAPFVDWLKTVSGTGKA